MIDWVLSMLCIEDPGPNLGRGLSEIAVLRRDTVIRATISVQKQDGFVTYFHS